MSGGGLARKDFASVGDRLAPQRFGPIGAEAVRAFAAVSGDRNPIHVDAAAARRAGLDAPPVHGMQLVALMHEAAAREGAAIRAFSTRFLAPVPVGEAVEVSGRVVKVDQGGADPHAVMRLFLTRGDGSLACVAEAEILIGAGTGSR
jgi:acyl dehydratase